MSTTDNIFVLNGLGSYILNQGSKLYCAFVDYTKAFDYIVHENLWYKMIKYGLRGKILNIIISMYSKLKSRVSSIIKLIINTNTHFFEVAGLLSRHIQTVWNPIRRHRKRRLVRVCIVCLQEFLFAIK